MANGSEAFFSNRAEKRASGERDTGMLAENFRVRAKEVRDIEQSDRCDGAAEKRHRLIMKRQDKEVADFVLPRMKGGRENRNEALRIGRA